MGAPVVNECEGEYHHDSRKSILEWSLPLIDESNSSGSMEFSINGHPDDFFPVNVTFVSKKSYCDIEVRIRTLGKKFGTAHITLTSKIVIPFPVFTLKNRLNIPNCQFSF